MFFLVFTIELTSVLTCFDQLMGCRDGRVQVGASSCFFVTRQASELSSSMLVCCDVLVAQMGEFLIFSS